MSFDSHITTVPSPILQHNPQLLYESWIELSRVALHDNIAFYRSIISPEKKLGIVVKSNAYGHGMIEIAQELEKNTHVDYLLVAQLSEGIHLRIKGIQKPIMLLNPTRIKHKALFDYRLEPMVTDFDMIQQLGTLAETLKKSIKIHIKIDTGLSRFGFHVDELSKIITHAQRYRLLHIASIYTHFAESNNSDLTFTQEQYAKFKRAIALLSLDPAPFIHVSNTAGISSLDDSLSTFVRLGAGAYGIWPSEQTRTTNWGPCSYYHLKPVLQWKTAIVHCKTVPAGTFIGYNRTYITEKTTRIGILPVGYYDGLDKRLSNKGCVRIDGQSAPIIGTIGMNATMIDISHVPSASCDSIVTLIGNEPCITPADLAQQTGCFNARQITTALNPTIIRLVV